jgi:predicted Fe-Mo cluster-binding NifX family protein
MKTVITSTGNNENAKFDLRFGRAAWYCLLDEESRELTFYENDQVNAQGGAGTKAAEKMIELKVGKVISGDFGPKAKDLLSRFKIQMVILQDDQSTIREIVDKIS